MSSVVVNVPPLASGTPLTNLAALIASLECRDRVSADEKAALQSASMETQDYGAGEDIVREGERPDRSSLMIKGFSGRYNTLGSGHRQLTSIQIPGDFMDLHSFELHSMDHGIVALSDCAVVTFSHDRLRGISDDFPHLTRLLWLLTLVDASIYRRWLVTMGGLQAVERLAHLICELAMRLDVVGLVSNRGFDMGLTQTDLADVLGISSVHINRVIQELRSRKLIVWTHRRLTILDWDALVALGEFNPNYLHLNRERR